MQHKAISIRAFIGAANFEISKSFYRDLGFEESALGETMSYFQIQNLGFYLQNAYIKEWVDNTMVFLEVENLDEYWSYLVDLKLTEKYEGVRLVPIRTLDWGRECFLHDPSGVLWHFGEFNKK